MQILFNDKLGHVVNSEVKQGSVSRQNKQIIQIEQETKFILFI